MIENKARVVILDRDGIINQDSLHYIKSLDEFIFLPKSAEAIANLTKAGYKVGIATNQSGIARGYYSHQTLKAIHAKMLEGINAVGGKIDAIEYCPHAPVEACSCRKPEPGML
ncbi:MAG: HAD-IIIA family hydrolase, partial [Chitinophagia bacterium]|nr:HAD-IIIA family hydrolase [Chitinophagia bacterium]